MTGRTRHVNIVFPDNGSGLTRDAAVLRSALRALGHRVSLTAYAPGPIPFLPRYGPELARNVFRTALQSAKRRWAGAGRKWDMNVFLERVRPEYLDAARRNCFIPNQEWLHDADREFLPALDRVLFKSAAAMQTLSHECGRSEFLGFVSVDRKRRLCPQAYAALHVGGWNPHKGTAVVCRAWRTGPGWPSLTVVSQLPHRGATAANVRIVSGRISDSRLAEWQNRCGIHICPSEVEGFGHTIAEGLSCGAIVVTTDAPPMNELITPECGILVPYAATEPMRAGTRYLVRDAELQGAVEALSRLGPNVRSQMARAARARFERMRDQFQSRLATIVDNP